MSSPTQTSSSWPGGATELTGTDELVTWFEKACRSDGHLIGTEQEKFGLYLAPQADGGPELPTPVRYREHVLPTLEAMRDRFGWEEGPDRGVNGELVMLVRDGASITLEPGGQFELSGAPLPTVHDTCAEFSTHYDELNAIAEPMGVSWIASGFHPFARRDEIDVMPKGRYVIMKNYLPTKGERALDMMFRTCTVQANFDYKDEAQCGLRLRMTMGISALMTALFANSPYVEGKSNGTRSMRSATWEHVDPDRCGLLPFVFEDDFSWERYIDWALDVPMFFVYRDGRYNPHHVPFRRYLAEGYTDPSGVHHRATQADWEGHLSILFPEVRIKPFIEVRGVDSVGSKTVCALPALCKGILYDDEARDGAWALVKALDFVGRMDLWKRARTDGLSDPEILGMCRQLLRLARGGLERLDVRDSKGRTEARFLDSLDDQVARGATPSGDVLARLGSEPGRSAESRRELVRSFHFAGAKF